MYSPILSGTPRNLHARLRRNLVAWWPLDEASGSRADSVGANPLTSNNSVGSAAGKVGNAASFTAASSQFLSAASSPALAVTGSFTLAGWAYFNDAAALVANCTLCYKGTSTTPSGYDFLLFADTLFRFRVSNGTAATTISSAGGTATSLWYFVVAWYDASAQTINLQINNGTVASTSHTLGVWNSGSDFRLGAVVGGRFLGGLLDEWGKWSRVLTAPERTYLYNSGAGRTYTTL